MQVAFAVGRFNRADEVEQRIARRERGLVSRRVGKAAAQVAPVAFHHRGTRQIIEEAPMPRPPMNRATRNSSNVRGIAESSAETA
jgi:hypothetical protein